VIAIGKIEQVTDIKRPAGGGHTSPWMECILTLSQGVKRDDRLSPLDTFVTFYVMGSHTFFVDKTVAACKHESISGLSAL